MHLGQDKGVMTMHPPCYSLSLHDSTTLQSLLLNVLCQSVCEVGGRKPRGGGPPSPLPLLQSLHLGQDKGLRTMHPTCNSLSLHDGTQNLLSLILPVLCHSDCEAGGREAGGGGPASPLTLLRVCI